MQPCLIYELIELTHGFEFVGGTAVTYPFKATGLVCAVCETIPIHQKTQGPFKNKKAFPLCNHYIQTTRTYPGLQQVRVLHGVS